MSSTLLDLPAKREQVAFPDGFSEADLHVAVRRIVKSQSFAKAPRLSSFLLYICDRTLAGRTGEITEQQIGVHVFSRPASYNAGEDTIVRTTARSLRQRLAMYYQEEGKDERLIVTIPRGAYIPHFSSKQSNAVLAESRGQEADPASKTATTIAISPAASPQSEDAITDTVYEELISEPERLGRTAFPVWVVLAATVVLSCMAWFSVHYARGFRRQTPCEVLWSQVFGKNHKTLLVPGDAGLNIYTAFSGRQVPIGEYRSGAYLTRPEALPPAGQKYSPLPNRRYTTLADLKLVAALTELAVRRSSGTDIRFARDLRMEDLQDAGLVLMGPPPFDPWIDLFSSNVNFNVAWESANSRFVVTNRKPLQGERPFYEWTADQGTGYGLISLTDNLHGTGKVLLISGTSTVGVDAARDFLLNGKQADPVLALAVDPSGKLHNFDLLLSADFVDGNGSNIRLVAKRVY